MDKRGTILVIDDAEEILFTLKFLLKQHFRSVYTETNPYHVPRLLRQHEPDVVLLDMNFGKGLNDGSEGLKWLGKIKELKPQTKVVMMTAYSDVGVAVAALKAGASDFVEKPWRNERLVATVNSALDLAQSLRQVAQLESAQRELTDTMSRGYGDMLGNSPAMKKVFKSVDKVAGTDANVLVLGENGTGKELIAARIHNQSERSRRVFIPVDLGAIPDSLFESEVFGHVKGAFTGANEDRIGRFVAAHGGTLFLDEIGNLSLPAQAKLLQVLQRRRVIPVGSNREIEVDIRLICATNMPLYQMVAEGSFRQDLLYRINTVEIHLPPLRMRTGDVALLSNEFLNQFGQKYNKPKLRFNKDALDLLEHYEWPGNVRELRHIIERAVIMSESDTIGSGDIVLHSARAMPGSDNEENLSLEEMERRLISVALDKHHGNISRAAADLGITRAALYRRLEKFDM